MTELKPCPFCGEVIDSPFIPEDGDMHYKFVMCNACGACAANSDTLPEADCVDVWNTRASCPTCADLRAELKALKIRREAELGVCESHCEVVADLRAELERTRRAADNYRAVLEGAEFCRLDILASETRDCRAIGEKAAERIKELLQVAKIGADVAEMNRYGELTPNQSEALGLPPWDGKTRRKED